MDCNSFWGIERSHMTKDIAKAQKVKFKTTNRDETVQEYTVPKVDGEHGAEWSVGVTRMFFMIAVEQCGILGPSRFVSFLKCLCGQALQVWVAVMELADYNSDSKRTNENFPKAWNKFFEMLYNCKNARDVYIPGFKLRWFKKPLMMSPFDYERRWNDIWNHSMTLLPGHRPILEAIMQLTYFFLGFPKPDWLAFHQICNL